MKSNKVLKLVIVLLLLGTMIPVVSAKKDAWKLKVMGIGTGTVNETPIAVGMRFTAKVSPSDDPASVWDYEGPAHGVLKFITPDQNILTDGMNYVSIAVDDAGKVQAFKCEVNGQFLPIKSVIGNDGEKQWVTKDAVYVTKKGPVILNLIWNFRVEIEGVDAGH